MALFHYYISHRAPHNALCVVGVQYLLLCQRPSLNTLIVVIFENLLIMTFHWLAFLILTSQHKPLIGVFVPTSLLFF